MCSCTSGERFIFNSQLKSVRSDDILPLTVINYPRVTKLTAVIRLCFNVTKRTITEHNL